MQDVLGNKIDIGDYVAYATRYGTLVLRVSKLEERKVWKYDRDTNQRSYGTKVIIAGRYAAGKGDEWSLCYLGHIRYFECESKAVKLFEVPPSLAKLLKA